MSQQQQQQQGQQGCKSYDPNDDGNWSPLTQISPVKSWVRGMQEYVSWHDAKGQYIRFAAEISVDGRYNHLAFSNRPVHSWVKQQNPATYRYTVHLKNTTPNIRQYVLGADQKCLNTGMKVDFQTANVQYFSVDILGQ